MPPTRSDRTRQQWAALPPEVRAARIEPAVRARKFNAAERYIKRLVASAPPLTADQRDRLALILMGVKS